MSGIEIDLRESRGLDSETLMSQPNMLTDIGIPNSQRAEGMLVAKHDQLKVGAAVSDPPLRD
jgi:hypothetical protein